MNTKLTALGIGICLLGSMLGCGSDKPKASETEKKITVFAAASLTESLKEIGDKYMAENKNVKILIDNTKNEINKLLENRGRIDDTKKEKEESYRKELENYKTEVWKIKTEYSGKDSILDFCFDGLKGSKDTLFKHLIDVKIDDDESICSVEELIKEASILRGTLEKQESINEINSDLANIEVEPIFAKIIVGKKDSSVADFIDRLQNSSWIEEGLSYVHFDDEKAQCPFCQQKTITKEIFKQINDFFDESYKKDKNTLKELLKQYKSEIKRIRDEIVLIKNNNFKHIE